MDSAIQEAPNITTSIDGMRLFDEVFDDFKEEVETAVAKRFNEVTKAAGKIDIHPNVLRAWIKEEIKRRVLCG